MRRTLIRALAVVIASSTLGVVVNALRQDTDKDGQPRQLPWVAAPKAPLPAEDQISLEEAKTLWKTGAAFFLDARAPRDYAAGHIAGAFNVPIEAFDEHYPQIATMVTQDTPLVTYCDGLECDLSHRLALRFRKLGYKDVHVLVNGWTVWKRADMPTKTGDKQ